MTAFFLRRCEALGPLCCPSDTGRVFCRATGGPGLEIAKLRLVLKGSSEAEGGQTACRIGPRPAVKLPAVRLRLLADVSSSHEPPAGQVPLASGTLMRTS